MKGAVQHYFPASLIGNFSPSTSGPRRNRPVYLARRGVQKVLRPQAEGCGRPSRNSQPYGPDLLMPLSLDGLWQKAESSLDDFTRGLLALELGEVAPAGWFVTVAAPYVGHLLARHPKLDVPGLPDLTQSHRGPSSYMARFGFAAIVIDAVLFRMQWTLALAPTAAPWINTDMGVVWLPGRGTGCFLLPVTPRCAVLLTSATPSYRFAQESVSVRSYEWSVADSQVVQDVMALVAPREVYAESEMQAERALDLWAGRCRGAQSTHGVPAELLTGMGAEQSIHPLLGSQPANPSLSMARFGAATHQFACDCEQQLAQLPFSRQAAVRETMHREMQWGIRSLRAPQELLTGSSDAFIGISLSDTIDTCAVANRRGLNVITPQGGDPRYREPQASATGTGTVNIPPRSAESLIKRRRGNKR